MIDQARNSSLGMLMAMMALLSCLAATAHAANDNCVTGRIVASSGPQNNSSLTFCLPALKSDPAILALLERLNQLEQENAESRHSVDRMLAAMDVTAQELSPKKLEKMASSLAERLVGSSQRSDTQVLREVDKLRLDFEELQERTTAARHSPQASEKADAAYGSDAGNAVARLDLKKAADIIGELSEIHQTVNSINEKVDVINKSMTDNNKISAAESALAAQAASKPQAADSAQSIETLVAARRQFGGRDLSGLTFKNAHLSGVEAPDAKFMMTVLEGADLKAAHLSRSDLSLATLFHADFGKADLTLVQAYFAQADNANFEGATLERSSWVAASLQHSNFHAARVRGADFTFADLRGADFREADLTNVFFGGADLRGARFDKSKFGNTDAVGALIDASGPAPSSVVCASRAGSNIQWSVMEERPSDKYASGVEYRDLYTFYSRVPNKVDAIFSRCKARAKEEMPPHNPGTVGDPPQWSDSISLKLPSSLVRSGDRERELVTLISKSAEMASQRLQLVTQSPVFARLKMELRQKLEARLKLLESSPGPAKMPVFNSDAQAVLLQKLDAEMLRLLKPDWEYLTSSGDGSWPNPYENIVDISTYVSRNDLTTEIYQKWTKIRSDTWPNPKLIYSRSYSSFMDVDRASLAPVASRLGVPADDLTYGPTFEPSRGNTVQGIFRLSGGGKAFLSHQYGPGERGRSAELILKPESVKYLPRDAGGNGAYVVWNVIVLY